MTSNYTASTLSDHEVPAVRLVDRAAGVEVAIAPTLGNRAYEMSVRGQNILHFPFANLSEAIGTRGLNGIPFLAPWANRISGGGFYSGGHWFPFNGDANTLRLDANGLPIHGLLSASPLWEVTETRADSDGASVTSRLEFWRHPELMANWPFAHTCQMTYRLSQGILEVEAVLLNGGSEPMPVAIGFHPYFVLPGVPRENAFARIPVRRRIVTDARLVATGETVPVDLPDPVPLATHQFDDGFTDLIRDPTDKAVFAIEGDDRRIEVIFGPKYTVAIVYAPPGHDFICFEPMTAPTNGINLAYEGLYSNLQYVEPGGEWRESFWVRT